MNQQKEEENVHVKYSKKVHKMKLGRHNFTKIGTATLKGRVWYINPIPAEGVGGAPPPIESFFLIEPRKMKIRPANGLTNPSWQ